MKYKSVWHLGVPMLPGTKEDFPHAVLALAQRWCAQEPEAFDQIYPAIGLALSNPVVSANRLFGVAQWSATRRADMSLQIMDLLWCFGYESADLHLHRADLLCRSGELDQALVAINRGLALDPNRAAAHNYLGHVWALHMNWQAAIDSFRRAIKLDPTFIDAYGNLGTCLLRLKQHDAAAQAYQQALRLAPQQAELQTNLALVELSRGNYQEGFRWYEHRWRTGELAPCLPITAQPLWLGQTDLAGRTVLAWAEQGLGDALQFCRYIPLLVQRGARVIVRIPEALVRLFQNSDLQAAQFITEGQALPPHDFHVPFMSLPLAFGTTVSSIPGLSPYLKASSLGMQRCLDLLGPRAGTRVGLVWAGRQYPRPNAPRDVPLNALEPLMQLNSEFICVQKEVSERDARELRARPNVRLCGEYLGDLQDTADVIANLDLLVTVDSAVAHLGAALGKEVWIMNRYSPCWRWSYDRTDSLWYPSVKLFNQTAPGDWFSVVQRLTEALAARL
ncbi:MULTISPECIES: tetratricopeptide repeat protein [unclassified Caballeronia]|uniref:tetratricopeptide repeat-containing glycosyltransferase family protein n=1 Tax=unclassified Caballeronia TaxID=2646786 RepID=UPI0020277081|nr:MULTISPECIES: tetratricopeptide repeat protein [unclassified Caballeronia]